MMSNVLIVDDNKEMIEVLSEELGESFNTLTAMNGQQALNILHQETVHLVVTDVMMPVMDGFELCVSIKSNIELSHIPVVMLTAKNTIQSKIEGLGFGADAYIEKPFDTDYLTAQIRSLLANRKKLKDYFLQSPVANLESIAYSRSDESFVEKLNEVILENIAEPDFDVDQLARLLNVGRTSLFRKIKSLTDLTPYELINITRLKKAAQLLADADYRIYEVADMVGFRSQTNFGKNFLRQFGMTPKEYQKNKRGEKK